MGFLYINKCSICGRYFDTIADDQIVCLDCQIKVERLRQQIEKN